MWLENAKWLNWIRRSGGCPEECKVGPHAEEEPDMDCESDGGEDGERVRLLPRLRTPSKKCERHVVSHVPFKVWCRYCVAGRGLERRHQKHPWHDDQYPLVCIDNGSLNGDGTLLGSTQVTIRSDGKPAVMQVASATSERCQKGRIRNRFGIFCAR